MLGLAIAPASVVVHIDEKRGTTTVSEDGTTIIATADSIPVVQMVGEASQTNTVGSTVNFAVQVDGTPPFSFRWLKGSTELSTASTLMLTNVQTDDVGTYTLIVSNPIGSVTNFATLTVQEPVVNQLDPLVTTLSTPTTKTNKTPGMVVTKEPVRFVLSTATYPNGAGTISISPGQPTNGFTSNTVVTLTASGGTFFGWSGSVSDTANPIHIKMDAKKSVVAFYIDSSLIWQNSKGSLATWFMDKTNFLGATGLKSPGVDWKLIAAYDFDRDGFKDFLFQHTAGRVAIWTMKANDFSTSVLVGSSPGTWKAIGVGDFDGDGYGDILFQHPDDKRLVYWRMNGTIFISAVNLNEGKIGSQAWKAEAVSDFNNDGAADILFQNTNDGRLAAWILNGPNSFTASTLAHNPGPNWQVVSLGEINGDGKKDIFFQNMDGRIAVWFMDGPAILGSCALNKGQPVATGWRLGGSK